MYQPWPTLLNLTDVALIDKRLAFGRDEHGNIILPIPGIPRPCGNRRQVAALLGLAIKREFCRRSAGGTRSEIPERQAILLQKQQSAL